MMRPTIGLISVIYVLGLSTPAPLKPEAVSTDSIETLNRQAVELRREGRFAESESILRRLLPTLRSIHGDHHREVAAVMANLGAVLRSRGDYSSAEIVLRRALAIDRESQGARSISVASDLNNLGLVYRDLGRHAEAEECFREAMEIVEETKGPRYPAYSTILHNRGFVLAAEGRHSEALRLYRSAMDRLEAAGDRSNMAGIRAGLGGALLSLGRYEEAESELRIAINEAGGIGPSARPAALAASRKLALALQGLKRHDESEQLYRETVDRHEALLGDSHRGTIKVRADYGAMLHRLGRHGEAITSLEESATGWDEARLHTPRLEDRATFMVSPWFLLCAARLAGGDSLGAWEAAERGLARSMLDRLPARGRADDGPPAIEPRTFERIQGRLGEREAMIGWVEADFGFGVTEVWGYVLQRAAPVRWTLLSPAGNGPDSAAAKEYGNQLCLGELANSASDRDSLPWCARIYRRFVEPVIDEIDEVDRLIVIPAGPMVGIPLEALAPPPGTSIGDRFVISYSPSASVLAALRRPDSVRSELPVLGRALFVGDPVLPEVSGGLPRLPHSRREIEAVSSLAEKSTVLLGEEANEEILAELGRTGSMEEYSTIHFATHGMLDHRRPDLSSLVLSQVARRDQAVALDIDVPDGRISAAEIGDWKLGADLVVLSACESGMGRQVSGEGHLGIAQAFLAAGAKSVVVSLWKVNDEATAGLMIEFYRSLAAGTGKAASLAGAKRRFRRSAAASSRPGWAEPYYWAGFILVGDPD